MAESHKIEVLLKTIDRHWTQAKQSEDQRAGMTNYLLTIYGASQAYIIQKDFNKPSLIIALIIIFLGIYGMIATYKYYERFRSHAAIVGTLMDDLDALNIGVNLDQIEKTAKAKHEAKFPHFHKIRLYSIWLTLHGFFIVLGLANAMIIILKNYYCISIF
jgi:hypothetical protein